jgi:alkylation response protein AidB-like acyl-CoA dehydrogenase
MDLRDSPAQARFRADLRQWLRQNLTPTPDTAALRAWSRALHAAGYAGITWPAAHGGRGLSPMFQGIYAEESALAGAPDHVNVIGLNMVGPTVIRYGTPAQQERFLPAILSGESIFCQGFSEPDAGSDLAAVRTRATPVDGGYVVDGEKVWSSYAHLADHCLLLARTDPTAPKHRGLTCFLLDMRAPGVEVRPLRQITGDAEFNQVVLTGVRLSADDVLGKPEDGWRVAMTTLSHERGTFGITLTARLAVQFDRLVATLRATGRHRDPVVRTAVAELYVELQALRYTGYRALSTLEREGEPGPESSILKLRWSQAHQRLTALATQALGLDAIRTGPAAPDGGHWPHHLLRSRANTIEGGTSEILRGIIAERVVGLPRAR